MLMVINMNLIKRFFIRTFQKVMYVASFFLSFREPVIIKGENSFENLTKLLKSYNKKNVLLVTDNTLHNLKMDEKVYTYFDKENINYTLYYNIDANPTIKQVEEGVNVYVSNKCDCIVVIGGGSPMDCAKAIGARVSNPKKSINKMKGILKVRKKLPLLIAIPTTAGTGSEATLAAVISNPESKEKFPIEDSKLIPCYAILNPSLLVNLPDKVTSTTGMDAYTHAIEAYIGKANTTKTKQSAILAVQLVNKYLYVSYKEPTNLLAREKMQEASYYAGVAFTRAYVGYVHAIAHTLGGFYHVPHGLANAIILPKVLKLYGKSVHKKLAELYDTIHINSDLSIENKANLFIEEIEKLNEDLNIPNNLKGIIKEQDIDLMIKRAMEEAIPLYPTPELWDYDKFEIIFKELM